MPKESIAVMNQDDAARLDRTTVGFWIYLMTDCVLFATLFAAYAVLRHNTAHGPSGAQIFKLNYVLAETLILLTSSLTCGLFMLAVRRKDIMQFKIWSLTTFILGAVFLALELTEFRQLVIDGNGWRSSAFLSSYFTLVGTHGLHILVGLLWIFVLLWRVSKQGLNDGNTRKLTQLSLFWHFLDIIWVAIFTVVYLIGVTS